MPRDQVLVLLKLILKNEILDDVRKLHRLWLPVTTAMDIMQMKFLVLFYQF